MRVSGTKRETVEIDIDPVGVLETMRDKWIRSVRKGEWVQGGHWYREYHTSHAWDSKEGEATEEEIKIYDAFRLVLDVVKNQK